MGRTPANPQQIQPRSHWLLLVMMLAVLAAALAVHGVIHYKSAGTGTAADTAPLAPESARSLGPVIDARGGTLEGHKPRPRTVALTFDDGPDPTWTPRILDVLRQYNVPATFFVIGAHVSLQPGLVRQEVESGHEVGVHTFTHVDLGAAHSRRATLELSQTQLAIAGAAGARTALLRLPYSSTPDSMTAPEYEAIRRASGHGYLTVLADADAEDWSRPGPQAIVEKAMPSDGKGAIILMHDGGGNRDQTIEALRILIPRLQQEGYTFATVSAATGLANPIVKAPTGQRLRGEAFLLAARGSELVITLLTWALIAVGLLTIVRMGVLVLAARYHARSRRRRRWRPEVLMPVSVIVPAYNEAAGIARTVRALVDSDYPQVEVIVVDDGSTDGTANAVARLRLPGVRVVRQPNRGKPAAIQTGLAQARSDLIVLLDGDTVFEKDTIYRLVQPFTDPSVGGVAGNAKVGNRRGLLALWQHIEYVIGFNLDRRLYDLLRCMPTVPGAVGAFRRHALDHVGPVSGETLAEDTDLTMTVVASGWRVVYEEYARGWTEAPATLGQLWRQRYRWCFGTLQAMWKHRGTLIRRGPAGRFGRRGLLYLGLFQVLLPLLGPVIDLFAIYGLIFLEPVPVLAIWLGFVAVQMLIGIIAFRLDGERLWPLVTLPLQQFVYRQLMYLVVVQSIVTAVSGAVLRWHKLERRGTARAPAHSRGAASGPPARGELADTQSAAHHHKEG
jgi:cellulose synthase/poly-beta-1,6-N-acetylglucosamine synthase-like glycosyltransferase/peptidoglycan/xylan/chitin deacetylase (PgdA/CDA1 family)